MWWQSHNLSVMCERGKKKVLTHSCKGILHLYKYGLITTISPNLATNECFFSYAVRFGIKYGHLKKS